MVYLEDESKEDHQFIQKINALLRSHFIGVNPEKLSNNEWAKLYQEYLYVKHTDLENLYKVIEGANKKALVEILSQVLKNG